MKVFALLLGIGALVLTGAQVALALPITIIDDAGPDDEPGQKDLNELTVDFAPAGSDLLVSWNWDVISVSGANTGDACALFDTDNDGNANYSLCVIWGNGATYETMRLYSCGDASAQRCTNPRPLLAEDLNADGDIADPGENLVGGPYASTCTLAVVADTFGARGGAQASTASDTRATCLIELDDFGAVGAFLLNVCSYPSQVPGSSPADCVVTPDSGFLTIVKAATPNDGTPFSFDLGAGQAANNGATSFSINGSGSESLIGFAAGTSYDLTEVVPAGWKLDSASCELSDGTATGTVGGATVTDFAIQVGRETTCTFTNSELATLSLVKNVITDNGGTAAATDWTLTATGSTPFSGSTGVSSVVDPGIYDLSEVGPAGYAASDWVCTTGQLDGDTVSLSAGDDVTCTITNDDISPSLTLVKTVINDNGGTAVPGDFTLTAAGFDPLDPQTGSYDLSESGPAGYTLTSLTCSNAVGQVSSVTLGLGDDVTCTFVNDDDAPSLTLVKTVINDNGGTAVPGDFTLTAAGFDPLDPQTGSFDLSESGPAGYTLTSLTCSNAVGQVTSVTLGLGDDVTCTFVNDDDAPSLTLVKQVITDNGGTAVPGDWTLTAAGFDPLDPQTGSYDLSETGPAGYTLTSLTCSNAAGQVDEVVLALGESVTCTFVNDDDAPSLTLVKQVINDNGGLAAPGDWTLTADGFDPLAPVAGTYDLSEIGPLGYSLVSLTCDNTPGPVTSVTLGLGESVTCTFVNDDDAPSLTLVKQVVNDNGGAAVPGDWTLTATGFDALSPQAGTFDLLESGPAGYTLSSLTCDNTPGQVSSVTLGLGESVTCTFVNDDNAPSLTLVKDVINDNGGSAVAGDFTLTATGFDPLSPAAGTFPLSETGPSGYTLTSLTCDNAVGPVTSVTLGLGESVTCTFVNDDDAPSLTLVKQVFNDNGGAAVPGDFTLTATGFDPLSPEAGTFDLSETGPAGYTLTSLTCDNAVGPVTSVTLGLGESVTCTFVNDDDAPSLTLVKQVFNDNGGSAVAGDFTLTATGFDPLSPAAGTFPLSETGPSGYTLTSLTCDNAVGPVTSVTLGLGESVTCTFVNDDDAPSLTLVKQVFNDNGGAAVPGDFTLTATGFDPLAPVAGTYDLLESGPAGYTLSSLTCDNTPGQVTEVTLALGEDVTCTFVNDDDAPSLTLVKTVINDNGGTAVPTDFTLTAAGYDAVSPQTGTYDLSETGPAGYTLTSLTCSNAIGEVTSVILGLGESVTCTFVNNDDAPSLTLVKTVINDNGGAAVPGDWTLTADGYDPLDPQVGSFDLSETGPAGYTLTSLTCDNAVGPVTSVTLGLGQSVTCTFVNDDNAPSLTLVKDVINDNGGTAVAGDFTLTATGFDPLSPAAGTFDLSETGPSGYTLSSLTCDNAIGEVTSVTLDIGEDVTCTFVNDDDAPSLTLVKLVVNDSGGTAVPGDWILTAAGYDPLSPAAGTFDLSETGPAGYTLTSLTCDNAIGEVTSVTLDIGEDVTCTFVNDDDAPKVETRTIGFWKNWSSCDGKGRQAPILDETLDSAGGITMGDVNIDNCEDAVNLLDKRDLGGKKRANDAAYGLAAQLLAAELNAQAGALVCKDAADAIFAAQGLLALIGFDGTGDYLGSKVRGPDADNRRAANSLASTLDRYNNGNLC